VKSVSVVIVEDHLVTLNGLESLLVNNGFEVVGKAQTAEDGLRLAVHLKPNLILLDLHLPGKQGPRSMVEAFCSSSAAKVVVFSAETRTAFVQAVLKSGAAGYLLKSETEERLVTALRRVVQQDTTVPVISQQLLANHRRLTKAQQNVLTLLATGMRYKEMADARGTSVATIRRQCELLQVTLGLGSREELIAWAAKNGYDTIDGGSSEP
jgi:DNA-binding NarL/FixJ family response regulator